MWFQNSLPTWFFQTMKNYFKHIHIIQNIPWSYLLRLFFLKSKRISYHETVMYYVFRKLKFAILINVFLNFSFLWFFYICTLQWICLPLCLLLHAPLSLPLCVSTFLFLCLSPCLSPPLSLSAFLWFETSKNLRT